MTTALVSDGPRYRDSLAAIADGETLDYCHVHDMYRCAWCEPSAGFILSAFQQSYHAMPRRITQLSYYGRCWRFWRQFPPTVGDPARCDHCGQLSYSPSDLCPPCFAEATGEH